MFKTPLGIFVLEIYMQITCQVHLYGILNRKLYMSILIHNIYLIFCISNLQAHAHSKTGIMAGGCSLSNGYPIEFGMTQIFCWKIYGKQTIFETSMLWMRLNEIQVKCAESNFSLNVGLLY